MAEGGELRHESVQLLGAQLEWLQLYQFTTPYSTSSAPLPAIAGDGGNLGACVDERINQTWPFTPIPNNATFEHFPITPTLSGSGITGAMQITENNPPNTVGNSTLRSYGFTYGGGAPGVAGTFNASLTPADATPEGIYTLDLGESFAPGQLDEGSNITYKFVDDYTPPLGIGGSATVAITAGKNLTLTWAAPQNDLGVGSTDEITRPDTYFNYVLFVDTTHARPEFLCFMDPVKPGTLTVPAYVLEQIQGDSPTGLIIDADETHYPAAAVNPSDPNGSAFKRFDVVTSREYVSEYQLH